MVSFESLKIEYKVGAVLGVTALVLSSVIGLAAGNTALYTLGRALFLGIVFVCLGTGLTMLLKKYVPELFSLSGEEQPGISSQPGTVPDGEGSSFSAGVSETGSSAPVSTGFDSTVGTSEPEFVPLGESIAAPQLGDEHLQPKSGSKSHSGKHILEEKGMKYEPKIMAEAIKTMMSKDQ